MSPIRAIHGLAGRLAPLFTAFLLAVLAGCIPSTKRIADPPAGLATTSGIGSVSLAWSASAGATGYNVKRGNSEAGPFATVGSPTTTAYTDQAVTPGILYYYVVSALAPDGESADSAPVVGFTLVTPQPPENLNGTPGDGQVQLSWSESLGAASYHVARSPNSNGPFTPLATVTAPSFLDTGLTNGTPYYYTVTAENAAGVSTAAGPLRVVPNIQIPPPTTFGTWTDVTPDEIDLESELCSNYGATTIQADPGNPSHLYTMFQCHGVWKSTDYGATWVGPINTGTNGALLKSCSGGVAIPPRSTGTPTLYAACIRGDATGFWKSIDGGVNWTQYTVSPTARQDYFPPAIDPYDADHLLMSGHEFDSLVESTDGGETWTSVSLAPGMLQEHLNPSIFFIDTGNPVTSRGTWLWIGDQAGGANGTWRTTNGGDDWVRVDSNEHIGQAQIYQPDTNGVVYMAGAYSAAGPGVLRSMDYGQTWDHVGFSMEQSVVIGTSKNVYALFGFAAGPGGDVNPLFQVGSQPGTGTWVMPGTPPSLRQGAAQVAAVNDGENNILVGAMWNGGVWRYVEP